MQLTAQQKTALKANIVANGATTPTPGAGGATFVISTRAASRNAADQQAIADWYNLAANPAYFAVRTDVPLVSIRNAILWSRYTPSVAITSANAAQASACANYCQAKQFNLQLLGLQGGRGGETFDATQATNTSGLKDATTALPSAAAFANQDAGWTGTTTCVANQLVRTMTNAEKLFAANGGVPALNDGTSLRGVWSNATGLGNPDTFTAQGTLTAGDVDDAELNG